MVELPAVTASPVPATLIVAPGRKLPPTLSVSLLPLSVMVVLANPTLVSDSASPLPFTMMRLKEAVVLLPRSEMATVSPDTAIT